MSNYSKVTALALFAFLLLLMVSGTFVPSRAIEGSLNLQIQDIIVNEVNLTTEEIELEFGVFTVYANLPFAVVIWAPTTLYYPETKERIIVILGEQKSTTYEFSKTNWRFLSNTKINTSIPNLFPFETYETQFIFGFNITDVRSSLIDSTPSYTLLREGKWQVEATLTNVTAQALSKHRDWSSTIAQYGLRRFLGLTLKLSHPEKYIMKMFIPTWGPSIFTFLLMSCQFGVLRRRLSRSDNISLFVAAAVFLLGLSLAMVGATPPGITWAELAIFILTVAYLGLLTWTIRRDQ